MNVNSIKKFRETYKDHTYSVRLAEGTIIKHNFIANYILWDDKDEEAVYISINNESHLGQNPITIMVTNYDQIVDLWANTTLDELHEYITEAGVDPEIVNKIKNDFKNINNLNSYIKK